LAVGRCCYDGSEHIYSLTMDGRLRLITAGNAARWSPDHRWLTFDRSRLGEGVPANQDAWLRDMRTGAERRLTFAQAPNQVRFLAFDGDPPIIAYDDHVGIWLLPLRGGRARLVAKGDANDLALSHRGSAIAFTTPDTDRSYGALVAVDLASHSRRVVFEGTRHTCGLNAPGWSKDGKWIVFALCTDKGGDNELFGIWLVRPDGSGLHRIATGTQPAWSPDGRWIAYSTSKENAAKNDQLSAIMVVTPDGKTRRRITRWAAGSSGLADEEIDW
jgi:Tol biopolymer transport system component